MTEQEKINLLQVDETKFNDDWYRKLHFKRDGFSLPEDVLQELSTDDVIVLSVHMDKQYDSMWGYGRLTKPMTVEYEGIPVKISHIQFHFEPYAAPGLCNYMSYVRLSYPPDVKKYSLFEEASNFYMEAQVVLNNKPWSIDAFLNFMSTKSLKGDDLACRLFTKHVQKVSREHKWAEHAKKIRKTQHTEEKDEPDTERD